MAPGLIHILTTDAGKAQTAGMSPSLEQRVEALEATVKELQEKVKRMARTRKLPYDPADLELPTNDCKKCDGTGHILGPDGVTLCECYDEFKEKIDRWSAAKRGVRHKINKKVERSYRR